MKSFSAALITLNPLNPFQGPRLYLIVLCLFAAASCSETSDVFVFEGEVLSTNEGEPLADVSVTISGQRISGGAFNPNFQTLGTDVTDAQGRFRIEAEKEVFNAFRITCTHPSHFAGVFAISPDDVPFSEPHFRTYTLEPTAWVRTTIRNINASQRIDLTANAPSDGCAECCKQLRIIREGEVFDTTFTCLAYGAQPISHTGNFRNSSGGTVIISQQQQTVAHDTVHIEITY